MRVSITLVLMGGVAFCQGCSLAGVATRVVSDRTLQRIDDCRERARDQKWAKAAWEQFTQANPSSSYSSDFAAGFQNGFAEYLYQGGGGEPPPLPPNQYRRLSYQTPEGYHAIEDWFSGYRAGAAEAHHGGYRQLVTGPSALRVPGAGHELSKPAGPAAEPLPAPTPVSPYATGQDARNAEKASH